MEPMTTNQVLKSRARTFLYGWIRINSYQKEIFISKDIINLLFMFYYVFMTESFTHYNSNKYQLSNNDLTLTKKGESKSLCYGLECISSKKGYGIHKWLFKIMKKTYYQKIAIGIDQTQYSNRDNGDFLSIRSWSNSANYALWSDGKVTCSSKINKSCPIGPKYKTYDKVCMVLDLRGSRHTLSYQINDSKWFLAAKVQVGDAIEYCMAVYIERKPDCVELLSYSSSKY